MISGHRSPEEQFELFKKGRQEIDGVWKKVRGMLKMALKIVANRFGNKKVND